MNSKSRTWIELSSDAFFYNINQIKRIIADMHLAVVLKANAYGHGLLEMGELADQCAQISFLCVAFLSEALMLRKGGVIKPILVLTYNDDDLSLAINQQISFVVDDHEQVYILHAVAQQHNTVFDVHIKVDTGLTRRGIDSAQVSPFITLVNQLPHIRITGICSHFSSAYDIDNTVAQQQASIFSLVLHELAQLNFYVPFVHMTNSSCASIPGCTMVRIGIASYGYVPKSLGIPLKPVLTLKTRVIQIKEIPTGTHVGYDRAYCTTRATKLALLPIGYADGYDTRFTNCGIMHVRGGYAPV